MLRVVFVAQADDDEGMPQRHLSDLEEEEVFHDCQEVFWKDEVDEVVDDCAHDRSTRGGRSSELER